MWRKTTCKWSSVGDVFNPVSMKMKPKKRNRSKKKRDAQGKTSVSDPPNSNMSCPTLALDVAENVRTKHGCSVAGATDAATKNSVEAKDVQAKHACVFTDAEEIFQIAPVTIFAGKSEEEVAATRIQTAIRGYMARSAWQSLRGGIRLKSHVAGASAKHQTSNALKYLETQSRVQFQVRSRHVKMSLESQAIQSHLLHSKQLKDIKVGDDWDASLLSKDQIKTNLFEKYEATMRRERSLAYSYVHQQPWNKPAKSTNLWFAGPNNPLLCWMWFNGWMTTPRIPARETTKCPACRLLNPDNPSTPSPRKPRSHLTPGTSCLKTASASSAGKENSASTSNSGKNSRSRHGRIMSAHSVPSYMAPTHSAKAKSKQPMESGKVHRSI